MGLPWKKHLEASETALAKIYPTYIGKWYLYTIGVTVFVVTAFFSFWLVSHSWYGYTLGIVGILLSVYILIKAWRYEKQAYWIFTSKRLIDVAKSGVWREEITSLPYEKITDVVIEKSGLGSALFNHGRIAITAEDDDVVFVLDNIRNPELVQHTLLEFRDRLVTRREMQAVGDLYETVIRALPELSEAQLISLEGKISKVLDGRLKNNV